MFGKILNIDDVTANVAINKDNMVVPNLMNLHVVFESEGHRILGEVKSADENTCQINLLGQFTDEGRFIAGTIIKPTLDAKVRIINDQELEIIF